MKKLVLLITLLFGSFVLTHAQDTLVLHITDMEWNETFYVCAGTTVIIYGEPDCDDTWWMVNSDPYTGDPLVIEIQAENELWSILYLSCNDEHQLLFYLSSPSTDMPNETTTSYWKHQHEAITLEAMPADSVEYYYGTTPVWSNGDSTWTTDVTEPGTYTCEIRHLAGCVPPVTRTFIVQDNVELYRATTNLRTNLNEVTWQVTEAQAAYVGEVEVYRNNQLIATVPYAEGAFTDDIGSEATQWQYHLVAVGHDGAACPIRSYWKRTIHLDHVQGTTGSEILQWTPYEDEDPDKATVLSYGIYDVVNGEPRPVIEVGNFTNVYAYDPDDFEGYGTVAAKFEGKGLEDLAFSNMTEDVLAVGASEGKAFRVYPNPAGGTFTVEGAREVTVTNTLGQAVAASRSEAGTHRLTLPPGVYFLKSETGAVWKVVVR